MTGPRLGAHVSSWLQWVSDREVDVHGDSSSERLICVRSMVGNRIDYWLR